MSYRTWHDYGVGINANKIETTAEKIRAFIALAPEYEKVCRKRIPAYDTLTTKELLEAIIDTRGDLWDYYGLATVICNVVSEKENIRLLACSDFYDTSYCIFPAMYPWTLSDEEMRLTEERLYDLFKKYIAYISVQSLEELDYGYQEVENGC